MFAIILLILVMAVYVFAFPKYVSEQVMTAYFGAGRDYQTVYTDEVSEDVGASGKKNLSGNPD